MALAAEMELELERISVAEVLELVLVLKNYLAYLKALVDASKLLNSITDTSA
ncbi:MAG: hypothetical protein AB4426_29285 [Xenococcaceae cyanobacterium]